MKQKADPVYEQSLLEKQAESDIPVVENVRQHEEYLAEALETAEREEATFREYLNAEPVPENSTLTQWPCAQLCLFTNLRTQLSSYSSPRTWLSRN